MAKTQQYWDTADEHKRIKSEIVCAYLKPWAQIIGKGSDNLFYLDLFSGRGQFHDGTLATPLKVLDLVRDNPPLKQKLQISFYEGNRANFRALQEVVRCHEVYTQLTYEPQITCQTINSDFIARLTCNIQPGTYTFIDPYGYSDISLDLLDAVTRSWGCDCLFYLSISGLVRNIKSEPKWPRIREFLGDGPFAKIERVLEKSTESTNLAKILFQEIEAELRRRREYYVLPYCVEFDQARRPSHYLVFLSKHYLGFKIMRDIMVKYSDVDADGLPLFAFSPKGGITHKQKEFFGTRRMRELADKLHRDFVPRTLRVRKVFDECLKRGYPYQDKHLLKAMEKLRLQRRLVKCELSGEREDTPITNKSVVTFVLSSEDGKGQ
ncbi:MAG: three-Cys-motif partner protein TcmP [candidate division Zixibacteria bacterium]|nr:three-Cys-motif partner protein TcmP [candidate division Zixibacteria bacterium]